MVDLGLVYDQRLPGLNGAARARQYAAMLEQCAWADRIGFSRIALREHHGSDDGYLPSPMVAAAAVAAVTERTTLLLQALVVTLHDPVRLAEDLAVLDLLSDGRLVVVAAAGYVDAEFAMFGVAAADRPRLVTEAVRVIRAAWTGEPFEHRGVLVQVRPMPRQTPGPPLLLGGASPAAARRAARIGDGFLPVRNRHYEHYVEAVANLGRPVPSPLPAAGPPFLFVAEDPDRAWARIAPYCLHESNAYGALARASGVQTGFVEHDDADGLRRSGAYRVMTPDEVVALCETLGPMGQLTIPALAGGLDPDLAWESLQLVADHVLPRVELSRVTPDDYRQSSPS